MRLRAGGDVGELPAPLPTVLAAAVRPFLRSVIDIDPLACLRTVVQRDVRVAIIQGDTDVQVSVADAELLHSAAPVANFTVIANMNHVLKEESTRSRRQTS